MEVSSLRNSPYLLPGSGIRRAVKDTERPSLSVTVPAMAWALTAATRCAAWALVMSMPLVVTGPLNHSSRLTEWVSPLQR